MQTLLHIGMPKTGSTVLQDRLRDSRAALLARGLLYPANPPGCPFNNHRLLLTGFLSYASLPRHIRRAAIYRPDNLAESYAAFCGHLAREVAETRPKQLILSTESLFRQLRKPGRAALRAALAPYGEVRVAVYLRRPSAYYLSALQQRLKASHEVEPPRVGSPLRLLADYERAFGAAALRPRVYDRATLVAGDIAADFLAAHLPEAGLTAGDLAPARRSNETLSAEAMDVQRAFREAFHADRPNVATPDSSQLVHALARIDAALQAPRPRLQPEVAEAIDYAHADPLALRDRWGLVFPGLDYDRLSRSRIHYRGLQGLLRDRPRPWRLAEIVPIDRELQRAMLDRLARSRWAGEDRARARWIAELLRDPATGPA